MIAVLSFLLAATWGAPFVDDDTAAKLEKNEIVRAHALEHGVIHYSMAARIDAPMPAVLGAVRDVCASIKRGDDAPKITFLLAPGVDAYLARENKDIADPALRALPTTDCKGAGQLTRYFVFADSPGHFPFPASQSLVRIEAKIDDAGSLSVKTAQVLGGLGGGGFEGESRYLPMPDGNVAYVEKGIFKLPSIIPDFLVKQMMDTPEDKDPQLLHLKELRERAKKHIAQ
jgi:hypothetical protein